MDDCTQEQEQVAEAKTDSASAKRERSRIQFPYFALDEALAVAGVIDANVTLGECEDDQLAPWLSLILDEQRTTARESLRPRPFGLIDSPSSGKFRSTDLGQKIVDPDQQGAAKSEALLTVPLFGAVYDR